VTEIPIVNPVTTGYVALTTSQSAVAFDRVDFGALVSQTAEVATNIDTELVNGNWVTADGVIQQLDTENTDYIAGTGLAGERFTISVNLTLPADNPDAGAGIVFHMNDRNEPGLGYMVRLGSGGGEIFWGRYDAGRVFSGEGGIPLELPAGEAIALSLIVRNSSFDIVLNGVTIVEAIPLERSSGWIGLVSFSGPVVFNNVNLQLGE